MANSNFLTYLRGRRPITPQVSTQNFTPRLTTGPSPGIDPTTGRFPQTPTSIRQYQMAREAQLGVGALSPDEIIRRGGPQKKTGETDLQYARRLNEWYRSQLPALAPTAEPWANVGLSSISGGGVEVRLPSSQPATQAASGYRPLSEVQQQSIGRVGSAFARYLGIEPTQQERTAQQADVLLNTSGLDEAERRYAQLEQTLQQMPYSQRLNQPQVVRAIQQEMEQLQKKIESGYSLAENYLRTQTEAERRIEEDRRRNEEANRLFQFQEESRRRNAKENQRAMEMYQNTLQSLAQRGFYQTPYAYQNV